MKMFNWLEVHKRQFVCETLNTQKKYYLALLDQFVVTYRQHKQHKGHYTKWSKPVESNWQQKILVSETNW